MCWRYAAASMSASSSAASPALILKIQPWPNGSVLSERGIAGERVIHLDDFAADRRVDVARGLHGLHDGDLVARLDLGAHLRQLDKDDIGQLVLRVVGDADGAGLQDRSIRGSRGSGDGRGRAHGGEFECRVMGWSLVCGRRVSSPSPRHIACRGFRSQSALPGLDSATGR